jgi:hypothetical protein
MLAFFRDLIEFLREFSSVPVEYRATGPSPRRVHRAAVRPDPYGQTLIGRPRPAGMSRAVRPAAARIDLVGTPAPGPGAAGTSEGPGALPAPVPPTSGRRRSANPKAAPPEKANPMRVPPFVAKM